MKVFESSIPEILIVERQSFGDDRGLFMELFQSQRYATMGIEAAFVQDNFSRSRAGVLRGLHFQNPKPQAKLVTVLRGSVIDVAVDVRVGSSTFGRHVKIELNEANRRQLWIPSGFAHGYLVLSETADVFYKCDEFYSPSDEIVLRWDDPEIGIDWGCSSPIVSERDSSGKKLSELGSLLPAFSAP